MHEAQASTARRHDVPCRAGPRSCGACRPGMAIYTTGGLDQDQTPLGHSRRRSFPHPQPPSNLSAFRHHRRRHGLLSPPPLPPPSPAPPLPPPAARRGQTRPRERLHGHHLRRPEPAPGLWAVPLRDPPAAPRRRPPPPRLRRIRALHPLPLLLPRRAAQASGGQAGLRVRRRRRRLRPPAQRRRRCRRQRLRRRPTPRRRPQGRALR